MKVYFDNAATTRVRDEVVDEISDLLKNCFGNPSSTHSFGRSSKSFIERSRKSIAKILNCEPGEIIFNSGGTESDNSILKCAVKDLGVKHIISSKIEHHAITHNLDEIEKTGVKVNYVSLNNQGEIDINSLEKLLKINNEPKLVTLMYINNEIGNILDIKSVSDICRKYNAYFHTDAVQAVGHFPIDLSSLKIDFLTSAGHKFHGPKGVGFAYINEKNKAYPLIIGGEQERGLRGGTESTHNIHGLKIALEEAYKNLLDDQKKVKSLKELFLKRVHKSVENVEVNGNFNESSYTILNLRFPITKDKKDLINFKLELAGIACSSGSACQSGSSQPSHVLSEILTKEEMKKISMRFSFSKFNSKNEIIYAADSIKNILSEC